MIWAALLVAVLVGGCAVVLGSGTATTRVDRKVEVASDNDVDADVQLKEKRR